MAEDANTPRKLGPFRSWVANLLAPGAGYLYVGKPKLTGALLALIFGSLLVICWTRLILMPWGFYLLGALLLVVPIVIAPLHAAWIAKTNKTAPERSYNRWWVYLAYAVGFLLLFSLLSQNRASWLGYEPFRIPATSMAPTVMKGDFILANTWAYRATAPERGDLVVLHRDQAPDTRYIKRVVAVPGDTLALEQGVLIINGEPIDELYLHEPRRERPYGRDFGPLELNAEQFFVLGDNRDKSADSRIWGPLRLDQFEGNAVYIWFSASKADGVRWQRFPERL